MKQIFKRWAFVALTALLAGTFTVLKLTGVIAWSWFWVVSPVTIPLTLAVLFVLIVRAAILSVNDELGEKNK